MIDKSNDIEIRFIYMSPNSYIVQYWYSERRFVLFLYHVDFGPDYKLGNNHFMIHSSSCPHCAII